MADVMTDPVTIVVSGQGYSAFVSWMDMAAGLHALGPMTREQAEALAAGLQRATVENELARGHREPRQVAISRV